MSFVAASGFPVEWICGVLVLGSDVSAGTVIFGPWAAKAVEVVVAALVVLVVDLMVVVVGSVVGTGWTNTSVVVEGGTSPLSSSMTAGWDVSS